MKEKGNYKQELAIFIAENGLVLIGFGGNVLLEKKKIKKKHNHPVQMGIEVSRDRPLELQPIITLNA